MSRRVDQLVAGFAEGDAISQDARRIQAALQSQGVTSEIFSPASRIAPAARNACREATDYRSGPDDVLVYHHSVRSSATRVFEEARARRIVRYHNITPGSFFRGYDDAMAAELDAARAELREVLGSADRVVAVSEYNARELRELGVAEVAVVPLFFQASDVSAQSDPAMLARFAPPLKNILFVGRMVPNKCVEELLLAFAWLNEALDGNTRLVLVGSDRSCPRYFAMLRMLAGRLELGNVCFERFLSGGQLSACYRSADLFVCASRHEGFCLPLIEAMHHDIPVLARQAGGMPEALAGAGVLFDDADPKALAVLIHRMLHTAKLRQQVLASQRDRMKQIRSRSVDDDCRALIEE